MSIATKHIRVTAKAPSSRGEFEGVIYHNPPDGDFDGERIADFVNLPGEFPLGYQHAYGDPGAKIGTVHVMVQEDNQHLTVLGKLDLSLPLARAVHERMLLPSGNKMALKELSVGFDVDYSKSTRDSNGVRVLHEVRLIEVSVVYEGAQETSITSVKNRNEPTWAGTRIPRHLVEELRSNASGVIEGFLDEIYEAEAKHMTPRKTTEHRARPTPAWDDLEIERINAWLDGVAPRKRPSDDLLRQLDELDTKTATGNIAPETASLLMQFAARLAQSATRAQVAGLPDAEAALMQASRDLRTIASGGLGDVTAIVATVRPLVSELRQAGQTVAAGNLERDLIELQGAAGVTNADRVGGSVGVTDNITDDRDRYTPKMLGPAPDIDSRMRPVEAAAAIPTQDVNEPDKLQVPTVSTQAESFRVPAGDVVSHRRAS
jgi:HK97 family phage prohead protease